MERRLYEMDKMTLDVSQREGLLLNSAWGLGKASQSVFQPLAPGVTDVAVNLVAPGSTAAQGKSMGGR